MQISARLPFFLANVTLWVAFGNTKRPKFRFFIHTFAALLQTINKQILFNLIQ